MLKDIADGLVKGRSFQMKSIVAELIARVEAMNTPIMLVPLPTRIREAITNTAVLISILIMYANGLFAAL